MPTVVTPTHTVRAATVATFLVFGLNGLVFASWAARIPTVTETLQLSSGQMGSLLLCIALGSLLAMPSTGWLVSRIGTANTIRGAGLLISAAVAGMAGSLLAGSVVGTAVALFAYGMGMGVWDVTQNIEGADVEHKLGRTVMPQFHAAFSGGAFIGALIGAGLSGIGAGLPGHLLVISVLVIAATFIASRYFLPHATSNLEAGFHPQEQVREKSPSAWRDTRTLLLGGVVLGATLAEGAGNDWIAKAAVDGLGAEESVGAIIYAVFVAAMTLMRFLGGRVIDRFGRVAVLRASMVAATLGLALFVFAENTFVAGIGAALWGLGAALAFPVGMSAAADDPKQAAARVSVVSTIGYVAFLAGPPLLGFLGDHTGIHFALLAICGPVLLALWLARVARPAGTTR
ncbi:MFS transporter [Paenarthrobacter nicotinovorans]|uniref:MFS transporter n=1 Tax=Paenarthrobacter nicotinovorans TaxID=29320 RepID=UPI0037499D46